MVDLRITAKPSSIKSPQTTTDESNERSTIKLRKHWLRKGDHSTPGLLAHIAISKYADHLLLFRQEKIYDTRHHMQLPRNTMARWIEQIADSLKLIYLCMADQLLAGDYLQIDETPIRYLQARKRQSPARLLLGLQ